MPNKLLKSSRAKEIETLVEHLSSEFVNTNTFSSITLMNKIIEKEGIQLREAKLQDLSGILYKDKKDWIILVNKEDSQKRKIFTAAHELGHYFLHRNEHKEFIDGQFVEPSFQREEISKYKQYEIEANEFAGNLIMPKSEIEKIIKNKKVSNRKIYKLAHYFDVSPYAIITRLKNLDYECP